MPAIPQAASPAEYELKYLLPRAAVPAARGALRTLCRRDGAHPRNDVVTTYYDTPDLDCLRDKLASHHDKVKLRLRWYAAAAGPADGPSFLELKFRIGAHRRKLRVEAPFRAAWLESAALDHPLLVRLPERLRDLGLIPSAGLRPVLTVRYSRRRYFEPGSGSRISLDAEIRTARVSPSLLPPPPPLPLGTAVLEVKNRVGELPPNLRPILRLGARRGSFSKYLACYERASASRVVAA